TSRHARTVPWPPSSWPAWATGPGSSARRTSRAEPRAERTGPSRSDLGPVVAFVAVIAGCPQQQGDQPAERRQAAQPAQRSREGGDHGDDEHQYEPADQRGPRPHRRVRGRGQVRIRLLEVAVDDLVVVELPGHVPAARPVPCAPARGRVRRPGPGHGLRARRLRRGVGAEGPERLLVLAAGGVVAPRGGPLGRGGLLRCPAGTQLQPLALEHAGELGVDVPRLGGRAPLGAHRGPPGTGTCCSRKRAEASKSISASWSSVARWWLRVSESRSTGPRTPAATMSLSVGGTVWATREVASSSGTSTAPSPRRVRRKRRCSCPTARTGMRA